MYAYVHMPAQLATVGSIGWDMHMYAHACICILRTCIYVYMGRRWKRRRPRRGWTLAGGGRQGSRFRQRPPSARQVREEETSEVGGR